MPATSTATPNEAARTPRRWAAVIAAPFLRLDYGVLPSVGFGAGIGAGVKVSGLEAVLSGVLWAPQSDHVGSTSLYSARFVRRSGELSFCYGWSRGGLQFGPCATATLEAVSAEGTGPLIVGIPVRTSWFGMGIAASAQWSLTPWLAVFMRPRLTVSTSRPKFAIDGTAALYQVPLASVGVALGAVWIL